LRRGKTNLPPYNEEEMTAQMCLDNEGGTDEQGKVDEIAD
jgi:hypothetical protein